MGAAMQPPMYDVYRDMKNFWDQNFVDEDNKQLLKCFNKFIYYFKMGNLLWNAKLKLIVSFFFTKYNNIWILALIFLFSFC